MPTGNDAYVSEFLREQMTRVDNLLSTVLEMKEPHISTDMHCFCSLFFQVVHVFRVTPPEQTAPIPREFDACQLRWANRLLSYMPDLPVNALWKTSLDLEDGEFGILPSCVVEVPSYVGSKFDIALVVAQLPGQPTIDDMTAGIPSLLSANYGARRDPYV